MGLDLKQIGLGMTSISFIATAPTEAQHIACAMAGSLLADLSRMGPDNAFADLVLTAQGAWEWDPRKSTNKSRSSNVINVFGYRWTAFTRRLQFLNCSLNVFTVDSDLC